MLLSSMALILQDIVAAMGISKDHPTRGLRGRAPSQPEKETEIIAQRIGRTLQQPRSFQMTRRLAAEIILAAALAKKGVYMRTDVTPGDVRSALTNPDVARFVENELCYGTPTSMGRKHLLESFENMAAVLSAAERELI